MKKLSFLLYALLPLLSVAQLTDRQLKEMINSATEPELIIEASSLVVEKRLYQAEMVVDKLIEIKPENANFNYRKGYILLQSKHRFKEAIPYFLKALPLVNDDYDFFSITDTTSPFSANFYIGECYHLDMQLEKAKEHYTTFLNQTKDKEDELTKLAVVRIEQTSNAIKALKIQKKSTLRNFEEINTEYPEYSPVISLDGKAIYFTSRRPWKNNESEAYKDSEFNDYPEDIYVSKRNDEGKWSRPKKLGFCTPDKNEATIAVSSDEKRIYVYKDDINNGDIYYSDFGNNRFSRVLALEYEGVNSKYWETHCTVTTDGLQMYFVSDRPEGFGGRDIYRVVKLPDGTWSKPMNLGPTINTANDEDAPFIASDNKTLYFASNGPESIGGFDIFYTVRDENGQWATPLNLGYPINSTGDDVFFTTTTDGSRGYITSYRENGKGGNDIYEVINDNLGEKLISVYYGEVKSIPNYNLPQDLVINFVEKSDERKNTKVNSFKNGKYFVNLQSCSNYTVNYTLGDSILLTEEISTKCDGGREDFYNNWFFDPVHKTIEQYNNDESQEELELVLAEEMLKKEARELARKELAEREKANKESSELPNGDMVSKKVKYGTDLNDLIKINPIYFDFNKSDIRPDAAKELDKIVKILNDNPQLSIKLNSHTDCRGNDNYNTNLSRRRANSSKEYITERISDSYRVSAEGMGETKPVENCECDECTEEQHQKNRRTEFIVIKM